MNAFHSKTYILTLRLCLYPMTGCQASFFTILLYNFLDFRYLSKILLKEFKALFCSA